MKSIISLSSLVPINTGITLNDNKKLQWVCATPGSTPFQIRVSEGQMEMFKNIIYKPQSSIMVGTPDCGKSLPILLSIISKTIELHN